MVLQDVLYISNTRSVSNIFSRPPLPSLHDRCPSKKLRFTTWSLSGASQFPPISPSLGRIQNFSKRKTLSILEFRLAIDYSRVISRAKSLLTGYVWLYPIRFSNMWSLLDFHESTLRLSVRSPQLSISPNLSDFDRTALHLSYVQRRICRSRDNWNGARTLGY